MFPSGTRLQTKDERLVVGDVLGQGGEGCVLEIRSEDGDPRYALKWYFAHTAVPARRRALAELVRRGAPHERFLWPIGLIDHPSDGSFGYLMRLRPESFVGVSQLLALRVPRSETAVLRIAFEMAHSFLALHAQGLCYRDINFGNLFVDPATGQALVCDNDNVGIDGVSQSFVRGSPKFMAPEVLVGSAAPSKRSDQYSLAVMLFYLLFAAHPLEGMRTEAVLADRAAHLRFYGYDPLFCLDPVDAGNAPHPMFHSHVPGLWSAMPSFVRELFTSSFTEGLRNPSARITDSEWCDAMLRLDDLLDSCGCGQWFFRDPTTPTHRCPSCGAMSDTLVARVGTNVLVVGDDLRVTQHHLEHDFVHDTVIAAAERHPDRPDVLGLRNLTTESWTFRGPDGAAGSVEPGRRVRLAAGVEIRIGRRRCIVERP